MKFSPCGKRREMNTTTREGYNFSKSFKRGDALLSFYLDIDSHDIVRDFGFDCSREDEAPLKAIQERVRGEDIDAILNMQVTTDDMPLFFLKESLREYKNPHFAKNYKRDLICRCFNVGKKEIRSKIRQLNLKEVHQVTESLKAGGGCTSCLADIKQILIDIHLSARHFL